MSEIKEVQEQMKADMEAMKNDGGHVKHEENNGKQCGCGCHYECCH